MRAYAHADIADMPSNIWLNVASDVVKYFGFWLQYWSNACCNWCVQVIFNTLFNIQEFENAKISTR